MPTIIEAARHPSPAPRPQAIAWDGARLWLGSIETDRIYALDPAEWRVVEFASAPGKPWGMTAVRKDLLVLCGEGAEDRRMIRRYKPDKGFEDDAIPCPDDAGSHLSFDGQTLWMSQWYKKSLVAVDPSGKGGKRFNAPHGICGHCYADGAFWLLGTDDEATTDYWLTRLDPATGQAVDVAQVPFQARGLAHDGQRFWTNHREQHEVVAFTTPA